MLFLLYNFDNMQGLKSQIGQGFTNLVSKLRSINKKNIFENTKSINKLPTYPILGKKLNKK